MAVKINTASYVGIKGNIVTVEVDICNGLPSFNIVGLANTAIKESKERVRAAIVNSGFEFPVSKITVNLAPADLKKDGSLFDLPVAIGILLATEQVYFKDVEKYLLMGELSLNGELKKIQGALPLIIEGIENNINNFIVPLENVKECSSVKKANIYPLNNLKQVINYITYRDLMPYEFEEVSYEKLNYNVDFKDVVGQESCKRAIEIAAAGNHNILMFGPPGSGKTMIAERIPTILPKLNYKEALEVTKIYSVSGNLDKELGLIYCRPFRNPHHTISKISLVGGGNKLMPGEISLAHNGILFLDEILEFKKNVLEVLRQPLESKQIKISRMNGTVCYPANFMLVGAMNPCPCGFYLSKTSKECTCSDYDIKRYLAKLSGPLLDRIDVFTFVNSLSYKEINSKISSESSENMRKRVEKARKLQLNRFEKENIYYNSDMNGKLIKKYCELDDTSNKLLEKIYTKFGLSNRAYTRILKLARTIADLNENKNILKQDIIEALQYRKFINNKIV
ncbi:competence protein ComM [Clostridium acetireducens DSM 10703]|uniref:Competence protein ComM n=1 Tax=Clostridium acetireducens DSM 10703 TaxID=1121290 RepID=A0A1E8F233_9CLOT|nr:YifB family Mg chelatase-like AAA ATPase [Clostridium acetireducens]OFI07712.1 competence protein ComM [Clostridium acetireducens DSM 10703]